METDIIGGFPESSPNCKGCGNALAVENAWMTDGCPCNSPLGVNSMNETRWRLLMRLQEQLARFKEYVHTRLDVMGVPANPSPVTVEVTGCRIGPRLDWVEARIKQHSV